MFDILRNSACVFTCCIDIVSFAPELSISIFVFQVAELLIDHRTAFPFQIPHKLRYADIGYLKGKSSLMIFDRHANLKYKYGNRHFWCRGYYVNTAGADTHAITAYIQNQLAEDQALE